MHCSIDASSSKSARLATRKKLIILPTRASKNGNGTSLLYRVHPAAWVALANGRAVSRSRTIGNAAFQGSSQETATAAERTAVCRNAKKRTGFGQGARQPAPYKTKKNDQAKLGGDCPRQCSSPSDMTQRSPDTSAKQIGLDQWPRSCSARSQPWTPAPLPAQARRHKACTV